jgi:SAM-dependent methyltransferase
VKEDCATFTCEICSGGQASGIYEAREMMFGLRTRFHYAQCAACGTLWLTDPPADHSPYYPSDYYSFTNGNSGAKKRVTDFLRAKRDRAYFGNGGLLGRFLAGRYEDGALRCVSKLNLRRDARILDVGCGCGKLLHRMVALGFKNLAGVDPFLAEERMNGGGVRIRKCRLEDLAKEKYDLVMFHHSLEHVADPKGTLRAAAQLLTPGGECLVRLPVVAHAWEQYGTNWVQLDPPRHRWVPTERSMESLAQSVGLRVKKVEYDSTEFQFWGSELYRRGLRLGVASPWRLAQEFGINELRKFRQRTKVLNRIGMGDQAAFLLECP